VSRRVVTALFALVVFAVCIVFDDLPRATFPLLVAAGKAIGPYGYSYVANTVWIAVPVLALALWRRSLGGALAELGVLSNPLRPLFFGLVATAPAAIGFALTRHPDSTLTLRGFVLLCLFSPFAEELLFRAFAFGLLYRGARWNFWVAVAIPTVFFAAGHAYQSTDPTELAGIFAITGLGSVLFSYFFVRFRFNFWAPFALHAMLNSWWTLFAVGDSALGGWTDNALRFGCIGLALGLCYAASVLRPFEIFVPKEGAWNA
jgi:membrane protease YdiL (CAAX protease family)